MTANVPDRPVVQNKFRPTRTVCDYGDESRLIYLMREKRYIWQRPVRQQKYRGKVVAVDVPIDAASDHEAMLAVRRITDEEMFGGKRLA